MPRRPKESLSLAESMHKLRLAGVEHSAPPTRPCSTDGLESLEQRLQAIFDLTTSKRKASHMLFFVMYDIESNKVRRLIAKYLDRKGCTRVQKSIFLADLPTATYQQIRTDLAEVQACYDNHDSILVVPISTDYLRSMRVIGQNIDIDIITKSKNTLFF